MSKQPTLSYNDRQASFHFALVAGAYTLLSSALVFVGISFGRECLIQQPRPGSSADFSATLANWDGYWYSEVVERGYSYDPNAQSSIAFFPAYPLVAKAVKNATGATSEISLIIVSNCCFIALVGVFSIYLGDRITDELQLRAAHFALIALCVWPVSFFFRVAYSESLFALVTTVSLLAMQRKWPLLVVAAIVGLSTACRSVGVAAWAVFAWHLMEQSRSKIRFAINAVLYLPIACWGLLAFMAFQLLAFHDPLAFVKTQENWASRVETPWPERIFWELALEPVWSKYVPGQAGWWGRWDRTANPLFSLDFANPVYFLLTACLVAVGRWKRWINNREAILSATLLAIPYLSHSYRTYMAAHARYCIAVLPAFMVCGQIAARLPIQLLVLLIALSATLMVLYSALFAAWYRFY